MKNKNPMVIPPEVNHWHGAAADSWFSHLAIEVSGEETYNEWLEAVEDDVYNKLAAMESMTGI